MRAGMKVSLASRRRLTSRGLGSSNRGSGSGNVYLIGTFLPKRSPAAPMSGYPKSLYFPSDRRVTKSCGGHLPGLGRDMRSDVSCKFRSRRRLRKGKEVENAEERRQFVPSDIAVQLSKAGI